ncbi:hypothetical protein SprV_0501965000 [Sparganum proliferum]
MEKDASESSSDFAVRPVETTTSSAVSDGWLSSASNLSENPVKSSKRDGGRTGFLKVPFGKLFRKPRSLRRFTEKSKKSNKADAAFPSREEDDFASTGTLHASELENSNLLAVSQGCVSDLFGGMTDAEKSPKLQKRGRKNSTQKKTTSTTVSSSSTTPTLLEDPGQHFAFLSTKTEMRNVRRNIKHLTDKISSENVGIETMLHKPKPASLENEKPSVRLQVREEQESREEISEEQHPCVLQHALKQEKNCLQTATTEPQNCDDFRTLNIMKDLNDVAQRFALPPGKSLEGIPEAVKQTIPGGPAESQGQSEYNHGKTERHFSLPTSSAVFCDPGIRTNGSYDFRCENDQEGLGTVSQTTAIQVLQELKVYVQKLTAEVQKFKQEQMSLVEPPALPGLESLSVEDTLHLVDGSPSRAVPKSTESTRNKSSQDVVLRTLKDLKAQLRSLHSNLDGISRSREEFTGSPLELETSFEATLLHTLADLKTKLKELASGLHRRHRQIDSLESSSQTEVPSDKAMAEPAAELKDLKRRLYEDIMRSYFGHSGLTTPTKEPVSQVIKQIPPTKVKQISTGVQYEDPRRDECIQRCLTVPDEKTALNLKTQSDTAFSSLEDNPGLETNTNQSAKTCDQSTQVIATPDPLFLKTMEEIRASMTLISEELLKHSLPGCACTTKSDASGVHSSISGTDPFLLEILEEIRESVQSVQKEKPVGAHPTDMFNLTEVMTALNDIRNSLSALQNEKTQVKPTAPERTCGPPQLITNMGDTPSRGKLSNRRTVCEWSSFSASEEDEEYDSSDPTEESFTSGHVNRRTKTPKCDNKMGTRIQSFTKRPGTVATERTIGRQKSTVPGTSGKACRKLARLLDLLDECEDDNEPCLKVPNPHSTVKKGGKNRDRTDRRYASPPAASPVPSCPPPPPPPPQSSFPPFVTFPSFAPVGYFRPPPPVQPPTQQPPVVPMSLAPRWYPPLPHTQPLPPPQPQPPHPTYVTGPAPAEGMPKSFTLSFTDNTSDDRTSTTISGRKFLCTQMLE